MELPCAERRSHVVQFCFDCALLPHSVQHSDELIRNTFLPLVSVSNAVLRSIRVATTGSFLSLSSSAIDFSAYTPCAAFTPPVNAVWKVLNSNFGGSSIPRVLPWLPYRSQARNGAVCFQRFRCWCLWDHTGTYFCPLSGMFQLSLCLLVRSSASGFQHHTRGALSIPLPPPREDFPDLNFLIALCKVWTVTSTQTLSSRAYNRLSTTFACVQWLSAGPFRPARRCHHKTWRWRPLDPCHRRCVSS